MTRLLEEAISKVRELLEAEQDEAAEILFSLIANQTTPVALDVETRAAVREGLELRHGIHASAGGFNSAENGEDSGHPSSDASAIR